jgi:dolichol-phosphate mannosyltransferase
VAIPVFNEQQYLRSVLARTRAYAQHILVVDDGSTDATAALLAEEKGLRVIRHAANQGYGQSLIDAFDHAAAEGFDWLITMDCDEQHEPKSIPAFVEAMQRDQSDVLSGSRYLRQRERGRRCQDDFSANDAEGRPSPKQNHPDTFFGAALDQDDLPPEDRRLINMRITALLNERLGLALTDAFCGFKAYRVSALRCLDLHERGYAFPMEFWPQAVHHGLAIEELPVRLVYTDASRHFGGALDDPAVRYRHYLEVFESAMRALAARPAMSECGPADARCCHSR